MRGVRLARDQPLTLGVMVAQVVLVHLAVVRIHEGQPLGELSESGLN